MKRLAILLLIIVAYVLPTLSQTITANCSNIQIQPNGKNTIYQDSHGTITQATIGYNGRRHAVV